MQHKKKASSQLASTKSVLFSYFILSGVVFTAPRRWDNLGHVAVVWYLQHVVVAKIVGGTPRFVATLRCGIYSTSALGQSTPSGGCVVFAVLCCSTLCGICSTLLQHFVHIQRDEREREREREGSDFFHLFEFSV